jgi:DNA mismatch repair protein MutS2
MWIDEQSIRDLEFDKVKELLSNYCKSNHAKQNALKIKFFKDIKDLKKEFAILHEIKQVYLDSSISFPHSSSEDIDYALRLLDIENGVLNLDELVKVFKLCLSTKEIIDFANLHAERFPLIFDACAHITRLKDILKIIHSILTPQWKIKNDATKDLAKIRKSIDENQFASNKNFEKLLSRYKSEGFLADTEESFLENRRLLAVLSIHRKKVKGKSYGVSSKGNLTYVEPEENILINQNLDKLRIEEHNEILEILREITNHLRFERPNLEAFQRLLVRFDLYNAKVLFAFTYNGCIPKLNNNNSMYWQNAVHPLLFLKNKSLQLPTVGQDIEMSLDKRFLVISGPNAGGKSVTLKTIGLLQTMFQCGLFVSVDDVSSFTMFQNILTDVGDNQSIDNQLSTYSYRLSRMRLFLENANEQTLLLLDEFGSGSDPELGGALAEVFFEELYHKNCFAVINTHYTNIKILSSSLQHSVNACMLFDTQKLTPLYKLSVGMPGSSFTFEVAKINGIENELIERAKLKISENKVKLDALTLGLQEEKSTYKKLNYEQVKLSIEAKKIVEEYSKLLQGLYSKVEQHKRFFDQQSKFIQTGKKLYEFIQQYKKHKTNKALNESVLKFIAIEKTKVKEQVNPVVLHNNLSSPKLPPMPKKNIVLPNKVEEVNPVLVEIKIGDRVKIKDNTTAGIVKDIKGDKFTVQMGNFTIQAKLSDIRKVQSL